MMDFQKPAKMMQELSTYYLYYVIAIAHGKKLKRGKLMEDLKNAIILHG